MAWPRSASGRTIGSGGLPSRWISSGAGPWSAVGSCAPADDSPSNIPTAPTTAAHTTRPMAVTVHPPRFLQHADLVAQLVLVVGPARIVLGERTAERLDAALDRLARRAGPEPVGHQIAHAFPVGIADAPMDALVPDHREAPVLDGEIDQHAVTLDGLVHAQAPEDVARPRQDVGYAPHPEPPRHAALQVHADLGGGPRLGGRDQIGRA